MREKIGLKMGTRYRTSTFSLPGSKVSASYQLCTHKGTLNLYLRMQTA